MQRSPLALRPHALALAVLLATWLIAAPSAHAGDRVPDTVGLDLGTAKAMIEREGFAVEVVRGGRGPEGVVLDQSPSGLSSQSAGTTVVLTVFGHTPKPGPGTSPPHNPPADQPPADAPTDNTPPPAANAYASYPADPPLNLNGPELPNSLGDPLFDAKDKLQEWNVEIEYTLAVPKHRGTVINQSPYPGTRLATSETVVIVVAREKVENDTESPVPSLDGKSVQQATLNLDSAGFSIAVRTRPSSPEQAGRILSQRPLAGSLAARGATVTVHIGRGDASRAARPATAGTPPSPSTLPAGSGAGLLRAPILRTPQDSESIPTSFGVSFDWAAMAKASEFDWELQQEMTGGSWRAIDVRRVKQGFRMTTLKRGRYRWRVRALEGTRPGDWTPFRLLYIY